MAIIFFFFYWRGIEQESGFMLFCDLVLCFNKVFAYAVQPQKSEITRTQLIEGGKNGINVLFPTDSTRVYFLCNFYCVS